MSPLAVAELAIYATLTLPTLYATYAHRAPGLLGWLYLTAFLTLRIVGSGLILSDPKSSSASTISNIGLSPLLLATSGILHEARYYRNSNKNQKMEWAMVVAYHTLVVLALALVASGASALTSITSASTPPPTSELTLVKIGILILLLAWLVLTAAALFSLRVAGYSPAMASLSGGTRLLYAVLASLPLTGVRVAYSVASIFSGNKHLSPSTGDLGYRVCLGLLPELGVVVVFIVVGVWTRGVRREGKGVIEGEGGVELGGAGGK